MDTVNKFPLCLSAPRNDMIAELANEGMPTVGLFARLQRTSIDNMSRGSMGLVGGAFVMGNVHKTTTMCVCDMDGDHMPADFLTRIYSCHSCEDWRYPYFDDTNLRDELISESSTMRKESPLWGRGLPETARPDGLGTPAKRFTILAFLHWLFEPTCYSTRYVGLGGVMRKLDDSSRMEFLTNTVNRDTLNRMAGSPRNQVAIQHLLLGGWWGIPTVQAANRIDTARDLAERGVIRVLPMPDSLGSHDLEIVEGTNKVRRKILTGLTAVISRHAYVSLMRELHAHTDDTFYRLIYRQGSGDAHPLGREPVDAHECGKIVLSVVPNGDLFRLNAWMTYSEKADYRTMNQLYNGLGGALWSVFTTLLLSIPVETLETPKKRLLRGAPYNCEVRLVKN